MWGIEMNNAQGVETLGMGDFTMRKIHEEIVPGATGPWVVGSLNSPYLITVPGYNSDECFVVISPRAYSGSSQSGSAEADVKTPVYMDMGGETIGIIRYVSERWYDLSNSRWRDRYKWCAVESVVEVFRVYGE